MSALLIPLIVVVVLCVWAIVAATIVSRNSKPRHRMHRPFLRSKYVVVDWSPKRPDGRRWAWKHLRKVRSIYIQVLALELVVWYWDVDPNRCAKTGCRAPYKWTVRPWNFEDRREEPTIRLCDKHLNERLRGGDRAVRPS